MDLVAPQLIAEYGGILAEFEGSGGELVSGDISDLVEASDVYYGDEGKLAEAFEAAGKPVYLQDYREKAAKELCGFLNINDTNEEDIAAVSEGVPEHRDIEYPKEWQALLYKQDGSRKKVVLYINSASTLVQYGDKMAEKLKSVLKTFFENKEDILLIWHPHEAIGQAVGMLDQDLYKEYQNILEEYGKAGWGILDEDMDTADLAGCADAYYGDADPAVEQMRKAGKPVMIADIEVK